MEWIARHGDAIAALTGVGTLIVWIVYLQVFVNSYRRQLRATMLITRGPGLGLQARCLLSNMSAGPVFVATVQVQLDKPDGPVAHPVTNIIDSDAVGEQPSPMRQGPLRNGETRDLGSFEQLLRHATEPQTSLQESLDGLRAITIEIVALYGSEDQPVGARRCFVLLNDGEKLVLRGKDLHTEQILRRRDRRRLLGDLERDQ